MIDQAKPLTGPIGWLAHAASLPNRLAWNSLGAMQSRTTAPYLLFQFFQDFALVYPVYLIYFQQTGLSYLQLSWLLAIWGAAVLLVEVPSGLLADLWSRKWSLVIGMVLKGAGFLVWLVRPDFTGFAVGFMLWGFQEAICTGTTEALLYDMLKDSEEESRFVEISGKGVLVGRLGVVLSVLLGGWVFSLDPALVMVASAVSMVAAALCAALLARPRSAHRGVPHAAGFRVHLRAVLASVQAAAAVKGMLPLVLFGSLSIVVYGVLDEYDFLFAQHRGVPVALVGVWGAGRFILEGLGAGLAHRLERLLGLQSPVRLAGWMTAAGLLLCVGVLGDSRTLLVFYFGFFAMMAVAEVAFQGWVQHRVESAGRATISSLVSFVYEAFGLGLVLLAGPVAESLGLTGLFVFGAIVVSAASVLFGISFFVAQS